MGRQGPLLGLEKGENILKDTAYPSTAHYCLRISGLLGFIYGTQSLTSSLPVSEGQRRWLGAYAPKRTSTPAH